MLISITQKSHDDAGQTLFQTSRRRRRSDNSGVKRVFSVEYFELVPRHRHLRRPQIIRGGFNIALIRTSLLKSVIPNLNRSHMYEEEGLLVSGSEATFIDLIARLGIL